MCGIAGYIDLQNEVSTAVIQRMNDTLVHRGPDDSGIFISDDKKVALGHRRLSFLDLSEHGRQPMENNSATIWLSFNGEIYNYLELKTELNDYAFRTDSDTEVILAGYEKWGIGVVNKLKGMFAFALFDEKQQQLYLVRDRLGIKPLYYTIQNNKLVFASELKAVLASDAVKKEIDFSAFADFFVYRYIPSPKTIWADVHKLPPAHYASIDARTLKIQLSEYWKLNAENKKTSEEQLIKETGELLHESVKEHLRADVPVGSFLSGGYDSSALVYYMSENHYRAPVFSIGFENWNNSEHRYAEMVAEKFGMEFHYEIADAKSRELIEKMPMVYDEPVADISVIPTYMVSRLARKNVKAVLSGEGADEIFGGYTWQHTFFEKSYPESLREKLRLLFNPIDVVTYYAQSMAMGWFDREELKKMLHENLHAFIPEDVHWFYREHFQQKLSPLKSIQYMDIKCFMGEMVLTKIDRASMANSLEVRVPFLDHELFEKVFSANEKTYYKKQQTKYVLYENVKNALPKEILERKKQGFVGPDTYLMDSKWHAEQLKNSLLVRHNVVRQSYIDKLLNEPYDWKLWKIVVMEKWYRKWIGEA